MFECRGKGEMEKVVETIKGEVENSGARVLKIILFGSRARGDASEDSDFDFLVITDMDMERQAKWDLIIKIKRKLALFKIPNDILINSLREFEERKDNVGYVTYYAWREGKAL